MNATSAWCEQHSERPLSATPKVTPSAYLTFRCRCSRRSATPAVPIFWCKADLGAAGRAGRPLSKAGDCGAALAAGVPRMLAKASTMA